MPLFAVTAADQILSCLLDAAVQGDQTALASLAAGLHADIRNFLRHRFTSALEMDIDDFTQESLLHLLPRLATCRASSAAGFRGWAFKAATRVVFDHCRSNQTALHSYPIDDDVCRAREQSCWEPRDSGEAADSHLSRLLIDDSCTDREEDYANTAVGLSVLLAKAQRCLPNETQELLYLRIVACRLWTDIGVSLAISSTAAKRRFQRGQQALRRQLVSDLRSVDEPFRSDAVMWLTRAARHERLKALDRQTASRGSVNR